MYCSEYFEIFEVTVKFLDLGQLVRASQIRKKEEYEFETNLPGKYK